MSESSRPEMMVALNKGFPGGSNGKEFACSVGYPALIPGSGRSPGEGNGYPFQYSCLENSMDRGVWQATVHRLQRVGHDRVTNTFTLNKWRVVVRTEREINL